MPQHSQAFSQDDGTLFDAIAHFDYETMTFVLRKKSPNEIQNLCQTKVEIVTK
jgi:predicted neutral ceramidase superfamily lipid hydrolase